MLTADAGYTHAIVYRVREHQGVDPAIPARKDPSRNRILLHRFLHDAGNDILKCPRRRGLRLLRVSGPCRFCARRALKGDCLPRTRINKELVIPHDYPALLRARTGMRNGTSVIDDVSSSRHAVRSLPRRDEDPARAPARSGAASTA